MILRSSSTLINRSFHFRWNPKTDAGSPDAKSFKLHWEIDNGKLPDVMELVSKGFEGSVSTPGLGSIAPPNYYKERHEYTAVIELPHNITDVVGDGALVIDVDIVADNRGKSELQLSYGKRKLELNKTKMNWRASEKHCVSRGGHLASMASPHHRYRLQDFADQNSFIKSVWLGGTDEAKEGEWIWTDGSTWSGKYWHPGQPDNGTDKNCLSSYVHKGYMAASPCFYTKPFICSMPSQELLNSDTQLVFTSENISTPTIKVRWVALPIHKDMSGYFLSTENGSQASLSSITKGARGGFNMKWQILGSKKNSNDSRKPISVWKIKSPNTSKFNLNIMTMMNLAHESKMRGVREKEVWKTLLERRWYFEILRMNSTQNESQIAELIFKIGKDLELRYDWNLWIPEEDIPFGFELFSAIHYCPEDLIEAAKLSSLFEVLIKYHSLNTVVAATVHNIQPRAGDNIKDFTAINMFFFIFITTLEGHVRVHFCES